MYDLNFNSIIFCPCHFNRKFAFAHCQFAAKTLSKSFHSLILIMISSMGLEIYTSKYIHVFYIDLSVYGQNDHIKLVIQMSVEWFD